MTELKNAGIRLALDDRGNIQKLTNLETGREYAGKEGLWRMIYSRGTDLERELSAENCRVSIQKLSEEKLLLTYTQMKDNTDTVDIRLSVLIELREDELHLKADLENHTPSEILREFQFPMLKNVRLRPQSKLIWSACGGACHKNIPAMVQSGFSCYMAQDNKAIEKSVLYPGRASTNSYVIDDGANSLYLGSHDESFQNTLHLLRKRGEKIDLAMVKYPYLKPGEKKSCPEYVISLYSGDWHRGALKYRKWADSWYHPQKPADSILGSNGWQRIIMRHQYGELLYKYTDMPRILRSGLKGDIDTLFLFGWFLEGHDAGYPEYHDEEAQGGKEALKQQIAEFRRNGGKVILYYNGQLIDKATEFYKTVGKRISIKNQSGDEHIEYYKFGGNGTALRLYGNKVFVTACHACGEWLEHLKKLADRAIELGCDGVFFDQLGFTSEACFDPSHGHPVPLMNPMEAKRRELKHLRDYIKSRAPQMSLGIEWISDPTSQYADYIHNISGAASALNNWETTGEKPEIADFPQWNRYIFPEVITTDREIRDDTDIPRRVNMALVYGFRSDVEIYRCRGLLDDAPVYQDYLARAGRIRDKYRNLILNGKFIDHDLIQCDNEEIFYSVFLHENQIAVVATQPHLPETSVTIKAGAEYRFLEADGLGEYEVEAENSTATVTLKQNGLAVILFEK